MWISKDEYKFLKDRDDRLRRKAKAFDEIMRRASTPNADETPGVSISEYAYVIPPDEFSKIMDRLRRAEDLVLSLTAERDWYKAHYADLKISEQT